ncbi:MAG: hypothetical protein ABFD07_19400, partial [Methanobacterium sp.]
MNTFDFIQDEYEKFINSIKKINDKLADEITILVQNNSVDGHLIFSADMASLEDQIRQILISHGYKKVTDKFISNLAIIKAENIDTYSRLRGLEKHIDESELLNLLEQNTIKNLKTTTFSQNIINPLSDEIRQMSLLNISLKDFREKLHSQFGQDSRFTRYINNVSSGIMTQYDGAIKKVIIDKYNPTVFYYVGDLIDSSRPFCIHMKEKYRGKKITFLQLKEDLDLYAPNGIPSEKKIEINGKMVKMGSGMMKGT